VNFVNDKSKTLDQIETELYNIIEVMRMNKLWESAVITEIGAAVYVAPNTGRHIHKNRPLHGFVLNDSEVVRNYCFDNGYVMRTAGNSLFYLPKGASYHVEQIQNGGCYAINFAADISDEPFCVTIRKADQLRHNFKAATDAWKSKEPMRVALAMRAIYDAVCTAQKEIHKQYVSKTQRSIIAPAVDVMNRQFTGNDLSVSYLASLCGISEVYFRKIFLNSFGVSPKEFIIQKRIDYAKILLKSGNFSISEIATLCGYTEPCHFSREFTKRAEIPPSQYF
jgi:AraC-like DNA-binding protein